MKSEHRSNGQPGHRSLQQNYIGKLDFATLVGRQCFSFGTSPWNMYTFPKDSGIDDFQFSMTVNYDGLCLAGGLREDIQLRRPSQSGFQPLKGTCVSLSSGSKIRVGKDQAYEFTILVADMSRFGTLIDEYVCQRSTRSHAAIRNRSLPKSAKRSRSKPTHERQVRRWAVGTAQSWCDQALPEHEPTPAATARPLPVFNRSWSGDKSAEPSVILVQG
ncbi:unnamed protein product [Zymoseptoria tritici ST99CH_1A5]|uniref:Uncharacterized protein n=1 Tax=Zymoseptoria tritici ST99CH_1A5 TaxID=1276529 RepID=A0A1Y6LZS8_ZYMTR|nr:unnamed protein product [Zymoseptoria tritici ST99CH_1A5]